MQRRLRFPGLSARNQPLLYVATAFVLGLLAASEAGISRQVWLGGMLSAWTGALMCRRSRRLAWIGLILIWIGSAAGGAWLWSRHEVRTEGAALRALVTRDEWDWEAPVEIRGTLDAEPEPAPDRFYLSLSLESLFSFRREHRIDGRIRIAVPLPDARAVNDFEGLGLRYGMRLRLLGHLRNLRVYRNPGSLDLEAILHRQGYDAAGSVKSPLLIEPLGDGDRNRILSGLYQLRSRILRTVLAKLHQPARGILAAALLGNRYFLTRRTGEMFREGGTYHLLVISGLHIGVIAGVVLWLAAAVSRRQFTRFALTIGVIWAYAIMVGAQPAVTRAAVMLTIVLIGRLLFRDSAGANSVAASAIILLVCDPSDIFNPAFQLSILTVLVIVVLTVPLHARMVRIGRWQPTALTPYPPNVPDRVRVFCEILFWDENAFRQEMRRSPIRYRLKKSPAAYWLGRLRMQKLLSAIVVTMFTTASIQLGLLPLMVGLFHRVSIIAPLSNVVEGMLMFVLIAGGALFLFTRELFPPLGQYLALPVDSLGEAALRCGERLQSFNSAGIRPADFGESSGWLYAAYFAGLIILVVALSQWNPLACGFDRHELRRRISIGVVGVALTALAITGFVLIVHPFAHRYEKGRLSVTFLDVGQGDAMLISFPRGKLMLLDSGGRAVFRNPSGDDGPGEDGEEDRLGVAEAALLPYLWFRGIQHLDWIAASHGDADHIEAFDELIDAMPVD